MSLRPTVDLYRFRFAFFVSGLLWAAIIFALLFLSGCASPAVAPTRVVTSTEKVLVKVPCVTNAQVKAQADAEPPHVASQTNGKAAHDLMVVAPNAMDLRTWGEKLLAILTACAADQDAFSSAN